MCTIIVLRDVRPDYPLVLATNRDEFFARPTAGPARLLEHPRVVGGLDLQAGGTWMGVTEQGLFVGVTNHRDARGREPAERSRGELVMHALALGEAPAIRAWLEQQDGRAFNSFNLMYGDSQAMHLAYGRRDRARLEFAPVPPGLHVLPNDRLDSPDFIKVTRAKALLEPHLLAPWPDLQRTLAATLADRELPSLEALDALPELGIPKPLLQQLAALCVRTPAYGTRSSTLIALEPGGVAHYLFADGPPDVTEFADVTPLFRS